MVWGVSWVLPSVYRSGTLILVEQPTVPSQYVVPNIASDNLQDRLQSITQQILSRTRLMRIIENQNLYATSRQRATPDEIVEQMRKDIEIELVHDRDQLTAFNVYYSSGDPHVAQRVTKELTDLFISENLEARQEQSENTTEFLRESSRGSQEVPHRTGRQNTPVQRRTPGRLAGSAAKQSADSERSAGPAGK